MEQINSKGIIRNTLDYLVKDYRNTLKDVFIVGLAGLLAFTSIGCPKKGGNDDVVTGSSGGQTATTLEFLESPDGVDKNYTNPTDPRKFGVVYTGENDPSYIRVKITNTGDNSSTETSMIRDTSVITGTWKDSNPKNGEAYYANVILPITGTYMFSFEVPGLSKGYSWITSLNPTDYTAWQNESSFDGIALTSNPIPPAVGESNELIDWILTANSSDVYAKLFIDMLYNSDEQLPNGQIRYAGQKGTRADYEPEIKNTLGVYKNGDPADEELPNNANGFESDAANPSLTIRLDGGKTHSWAFNSQRANTNRKVWNVIVPRTLYKNSQ